MNYIPTGELRWTLAPRDQAPAGLIVDGYILEQLWRDEFISYDEPMRQNGYHKEKWRGVGMSAPSQIFTCYGVISPEGSVIQCYAKVEAANKHLLSCPSGWKVIRLRQN